VALNQPEGANSRTLRQISGAVYCTNRDLPLVEPEGGWREALALAGAGPVAGVRFRVGPTPPRRSLAAEGGRRVWQLVNHLSADHLLLGAGTDSNQDGKLGAAMLRDLLSLYCHTDRPQQTRQVDGVLGLRGRAVTRRLPLAGPLVHGRGTQLELQLDEAAFEGGSGFLLATVLDQFFARFTNLNSFTELTLHSSTRGQIHRWPVRLGDVAPL
jgi:type VI secretion system protein ImpG